MQILITLTYPPLLQYLVYSLVSSRHTNLTLKRHLETEHTVQLEISAAQKFCEFCESTSKHRNVIRKCHAPNKSVC